MSVVIFIFSSQLRPSLTARDLNEYPEHAVPEEALDEGNFAWLHDGVEEEDAEEDGDEDD